MRELNLNISNKKNSIYISLKYFYLQNNAHGIFNNAEG